MRALFPAALLATIMLSSARGEQTAVSASGRDLRALPEVKAAEELYTYFSDALPDYDLNKDGKLSPSEFLALPPGIRAVASDVDGDGFYTMGELRLPWIHDSVAESGGFRLDDGEEPRDGRWGKLVPLAYRVEPGVALARKGISGARVYSGWSGDTSFLLEIIGKPDGRATMRLSRPRWIHKRDLIINIDAMEWRALQQRLIAWQTKFATDLYGQAGYAYSTMRGTPNIEVWTPRAEIPYPGAGGYFPLGPQTQIANELMQFALAHMPACRAVLVGENKVVLTDDPWKDQSDWALDGCARLSGNVKAAAEVLEEADGFGRGWVFSEALVKRSAERVRISLGGAASAEGTSKIEPFLAAPAARLEAAPGQSDGRRSSWIFKNVAYRGQSPNRVEMSGFLSYSDDGPDSPVWSTPARLIWTKGAGGWQISQWIVGRPPHFPDKANPEMASFLAAMEQLRKTVRAERGFPQ